MRKTSTTYSTIVVSILTLLGTFIGFGRESYIAYAFGATGLTDAFYIATVLPDMFAGLLASALTAALVPALKAEVRVSLASAYRLVRIVLVLTSIAFVVITLITFLLKAPLLHLIAPGISLQERTIAFRLLVIMSFAIVFTGLSGVLTGIHNAFDSFTYPSFLGISYNVVMLAVSVLLKRVLGIDALAYGFLFGTISRFIVQLLPLIRREFTGVATERLSWHPSVYPIIKAIGPMLAITGLGSLNLIVDRILASGLPPGRISELNFASKLGMIPGAIIGTSIATTLYSRFIIHRLDNDNDELKRMFSLGTSWVLFISIVVMDVFVLWGSQLIYMLYRHGEFPLADVYVAAGPLRIYGIFSLAYLLVPMLSRLLFALQYARRALYISFASVGVNIVASLLLVHKLGINGLALANGMSQLVQVTLMLIVIAHTLCWKLIPTVYSMMKGFPAGIAFVIGTVIPLVALIQHQGIIDIKDLVMSAAAGVMGSTFLVIHSYIFVNDMIGRQVKRSINSVLKYSKGILFIRGK